MALDISVAAKQVEQLSQQSAAAVHTARVLSAYKEQLNSSWSGEEIKYMNYVIDELIRQCEKLSEETEAVSRDIARAISEILAEGTAVIIS